MRVISTDEGADVNGGGGVGDASEAEARGIEVGAVGKSLSGLAPTRRKLSILALSNSDTEKRTELG